MLALGGIVPMLVTQLRLRRGEPQTSSGVWRDRIRLRRQRMPAALLAVLPATELALASLGVVKELRKPQEERTGTGLVLGVFPYDYRPLTRERLRDTLWNPDDHRVLNGRVFGVGWAVNFYEVKRRILARWQALFAAPETPAAAGMVEA
jgi:hypothetical protein